MTAPEVDAALGQVAAVAAEPSETPKKLSMVVMSGDFDKLFGAFIIATGAKAMGMDVVMFFTFWGLRAIRKANVRTGTSVFGKLIGLMYGGDIEKANPSQFSFFGIGRWMFKKMMKSKGVTDIKELRDLAVDMGVRMYGCDMSMTVMEMPQSSMIDCIDQPVGVAVFLAEAMDSQITLFV